MENNEENVLELPPGAVVFSHLKTPQMFEGRKVISLTLKFDPSKSKGAANLKARLNKEIASVTGGSEPSFKTIKPFMLKNEETGDYDVPHATEFQVTIKAPFDREKQDIIRPHVQEGLLVEENEPLEGDDLLLPRNSVVQTKARIKKIDFTPKGKDKAIQGVTLELLAVGVISRPSVSSSNHKRGEPVEGDLTEGL